MMRSLVCDRFVEDVVCAVVGRVDTLKRCGVSRSEDEAQ